MLQEGIGDRKETSKGRIRSINVQYFDEPKENDLPCNEESIRENFTI